MKPSGVPETDLVLIFTRPMEQAGMRYFVTGSMAGMLYGEPRLTMDVDIVLVLPPTAIKELVEAFDPAQFYRPPIEIIMQEVGRRVRGHFNLIHHDTGFKADIYLAGSDSLHAWAFTKRRAIRIGEDTVWVAAPEYVILRKLEYYNEGRSEKHLRDIHAMFERSSDEIDDAVLMQKVDEQGLKDVWQHFMDWRKER